MLHRPVVNRSKAWLNDQPDSLPSNFPTIFRSEPSVWKCALRPAAEGKAEIAVLVGHIEVGCFYDVAVQASEDCPRFPFRLKQLVDSAHSHLTIRTLARCVGTVAVPFCEEAIRELFSISLLARRHGITVGTR